MRKTAFAMLFAVLTALLAAGSPALAQFAGGSLAAPGQVVPKDAVRERGGAPGAELAGYIGVRPVLAVWWRPGDALSERALLGAHAAWKEGAKDAVFFPVALLAAGQTTGKLSQRLGELKLPDVARRADNGSLALALGVRRVPTFALIDVSGVLRAIGGSDIGQPTPGGMTLLEALGRAARGEAIPTLGELPSRPTYQLLGRKVPELSVTEQNGKTWRSLEDYLEPGKKVLLFYWKPSCSHCREAIPGLRDWHASRKSKDVILIDIARADSPKLKQDAVALLEGAPWVHLLDTLNTVSRRLLVTETPTSFLIDETGEVLSIQVGGQVDWDAWVSGSGKSARR